MGTKLRPRGLAPRDALQVPPPKIQAPDPQARPPLRAGPSPLDSHEQEQCALAADRARRCSRLSTPVELLTAGSTLSITSCCIRYEVSSQVPGKKA